MTCFFQCISILNMFLLENSESPTVLKLSASLDIFDVLILGSYVFTSWIVFILFAYLVIKIVWLFRRSDHRDFHFCSSRDREERMTWREHTVICWFCLPVAVEVMLNYVFSLGDTTFANLLLFEVQKNYLTEVCGTDVENVIFTFFPLLLQGLCSGELGGILREEPGGSESSSQAMHGEELGR